MFPRRCIANTQPTVISKKELPSLQDNADTISIPELDQFHNDKNILQAVALATTNHEINSGKFDDFISRIIENTTENYPIDFIISVNNSNHVDITDKLDQLRTIFREVIYLNTNISIIDDVYRIIQSNNGIPKLGAVSGPNILFYETMKYLKKYNTILLLETDCIVYKDWLPKIINYVKYGGDFLISGSSYDGVYKFPLTRLPSFFHLNGVALYKTGSIALQYVLQEVMLYIRRDVTKGNIFSPYDVCITKMIFENLLNVENPNYDFWKLVYRNFIKNTLIVNAALSLDTSEPESKFLKLFPSCVILHKKLG